MIISLTLTYLDTGHIGYSTFSVIISGVTSTLNLKNSDIMRFIDRIEPIEIKNVLGDIISRERLLEIIKEAG